MPYREVVMDIRGVLDFVEKRHVSENSALKDLPDAPQEVREGVFRFHLKDVEGVRRPLFSLRRLSHEVGGLEDGQRAWHGCKLEALYSVIVEGTLKASCSSEERHTLFQGCPGVNLHCGQTRFKALSNA